MRLYYFNTQNGNFGDDLNGWLWSRLAPDAWREMDDVLFYGIGTIIGNPAPPARKAVVFGSGFGYSSIPENWGSDHWDIAAVRGPLTAKILGLPEGKAVIDGAALLAKLPEFSPVPDADRLEVLFVPHHEAMAVQEWQSACDKAGVTLLDPRGDSVEVIQRLRHAKLVIADSMHAAIISDVLRVPWIPVMSSKQISTFKWLDWAMSLSVPYEPVRLHHPSIDSAVFSHTLPLIGQAHSVTPPTPEKALEHLKAMMTPLSEAEREASYRRKWKLHDRPLKWVRDSRSKRVTSTIDSRWTDATARQLQALAGRKGYLSDMAVIRSKTEELYDRFRRVITAYA